MFLQLWAQTYCCVEQPEKIQDFNGVRSRDLVIPVRCCHQLNYEGFLKQWYDCAHNCENIASLKKIKTRSTTYDSFLITLFIKIITIIIIIFIIIIISIIIHTSTLLCQCVRGPHLKQQSGCYYDSIQPRQNAVRLCRWEGWRFSPSSGVVWV